MKEYNYALGARLKAAMKAASYSSAKEFCETIKIPYLTFAQHAQGRRHPTAELLKLYSDALGVTVQWLETGEGNPLANRKQSTKSAKIVKLTSSEINKRFRLEQLLHVALDTSLLKEIIKKLLSAKFALDQKEAEKLAKAISLIYNDISSMKEDDNTKQKMIQVAVNTFLQNMG